MKRFFRRVSKCIRWGCLAGIALVCVGCGSESGSYNQKKPIQSIDTAMGTIISQTIYMDADAETNADPDSGKKEADINSGETKITADILQTVTDLEQKLLSWRLDSSELYAINTNAGQESGILLSEELTEILTKCLEVSDASEGAFDITIGEVVRLWNIDSWAGAEDNSDYKIPGKTDIVAALEHTGYEKLALQGNNLYLPAEMQLDLGAVGKGIALDSLQEYLTEQEEVTGAVISVGGSILTYGQKSDGTPWRVGIVNPSDSSKNLGYLELIGRWCISTSGDYERYVEVDGNRYHHIINPSTGYPADSGLSSVTILTKDGLLSDALSTACFILGQEKGEALVETYGVEAVFVDHEGNVFMTEGMEQYFRLY